MSDFTEQMAQEAQAVTMVAGTKLHVAQAEQQAELVVSSVEHQGEEVVQFQRTRFQEEAREFYRQTVDECAQKMETVRAIAGHEMSEARAALGASWIRTNGWKRA